MSGAVELGASWDADVAAWRDLGRQVDGAAWSRAEIAASISGKYGKVKEFAEEVGVSTQTIRALATTYDRFPESADRSADLSFTHHLTAAIKTATADEAKTALALAAREGWSANALRAHLTRPMLPEACGAESCGPVTLRDQAVHVAALVDSLQQSATIFEAIKDYDLGPIVRGGTKKSLREVYLQIGPLMRWLEALQQTIKERMR